VVAENVAVVLPAGTVTEAGTETPLVLEAKLTTAPPEGAATSIVTVPVAVAPPITDEGEKDRDTGTGGVSAKVAAAELSGVEAVIVTLTPDDTDDVAILNVAELAPCGTVTDAGVEADGLLDLRATTKPPFPACPLRVTVPTEPKPPTTVDGASDKLVGEGALTVSTHVTFGPKA